MKSVARNIKNRTYPVRDEFIGSLPKDFIEKMQKEDIAENTRKIQNLFYNFSKQMQSFDIERKKNIAPEVVKLSQKLKEITQISDLSVKEYGSGKIGRTFLIETTKHKYMLKMFFHPDIIYHDPSRNHDLELKNMLLTHKYDQARRAPKLFAGKFGRDGFILMKFIDDNASKKTTGLFASGIRLIGTSDDHYDNVRGDTLLDFGMSDRREEFFNVKVTKIARLIADALDKDSPGLAKKVLTAHGQDKEFETAFAAVLEYGKVNRLLYSYDETVQKFPIKALRAFGAKASSLMLEKLTEKSLNWYDLEFMEKYYNPLEIIESWYKKFGKKLNQADSNEEVAWAFSRGITVEKLEKIGFARENIKLSVERNLYEIIHSGVSVARLKDLGFTQKDLMNAIEYSGQSGKLKLKTRVLMQTGKQKLLKLIGDKRLSRLQSLIGKTVEN